MSARTAWLRDRLAHRVNGTIQRHTRPSGMDVPAREWDTLVVLDACRADLYRDTDHPIREAWDVETVTASSASSTDDWLAETWSDEHADTVYVAGNPLVSRHASGGWHELVDVWRDAWDEETGTIPAEPITHAALRAHEEHPDKRVVVHYLQPHAPLLDGSRFDGWQSLQDVDADGRRGYKNIWLAAADGQVSHDDAWRRYKDTLEYVLDEVQRLLGDIDGRIALTSDHGNYLGERGWPLPIRQYGHPPGHGQQAVRHVPWCIREGERREIRAGRVSTSLVGGPDEEQLEALGYV